MRTALLAVVFVSLTVSAQARLGETPDQLVARYGQPLKEDDQKADGSKISLANVVFQKGGYEIDVTITGGFSVQEIFKKINGSSISVPEARILLTANSQEHQWNAPVKTKESLVWVRDDDAVATLSSNGSMIIRSRELAAEEAGAKALEEHPSLEGF